MRGAGLIVWTFSAACCCASSLLAPFPVSLTCRLSQRAFRFISLSHYNELVIQNKENNHHLFVHITVSFNYLPILSSSFNNKGNNHIPTRVNNFNPTHPISKTKHEAGVFSLHRFTIKANGIRGGSECQYC